MARVALACAANVLISVVSTCLYYNELYALVQQPNFATQLGAAMQATFCGVVLLVLDISGLASRRDSPRIHTCRWAELAVLFSLGNTLEIASIDGIGSAAGSLTTVLAQVAIPISLVASAVLLRKRYRATHFVAAAVVCGGIAASYAPTVSSPQRLPAAWVLCYCASRVPMVLANVRSEQLLAREAERGKRTAWGALRSVVRAGFWTSVLSLGCNVPAAWALKAAAGGAGGGAASSLAAEYADGAKCLLRLPSRQNASLHSLLATDHPRATGLARASTRPLDRRALSRALSTAPPLPTPPKVDRCSMAGPAAAAFFVPGALFALSEFHVLQLVSAARHDGGVGRDVRRGRRAHERGGWGWGGYGGGRGRRGGLERG